MYLESDPNSDVGGMRSYLKCDVQYPLRQLMQRRCRNVSFCCVLKRCCSDRVHELHGFWTADPGLERWQRNLRWCLPSWEVTWTNTKALLSRWFSFFPFGVFTRKLLHLEDANVRLDSENKNPELGWLIWLPPVFFQGCIHIYIPTGDFLHLFG